MDKPRPKPRYTQEQVEALLKKYFPKLEINPESSTLNVQEQLFEFVTHSTPSGWLLFLESTGATDEPVIGYLTCKGQYVISAHKLEGIEECLQSLESQLREVAG
jgi:hypothetical protein